MDQEKLNLYRHSLAHVLAASVLKLWPKARFGVGPVIDSGFYYDIEIPDYKLTEKDLEKISKAMIELIKSDLKFERQEITISEAIETFAKYGQVYKVELLNSLKDKGTTKLNPEEAEVFASGDPSISLYQTGDFLDLCRGPHVTSTLELNNCAWKLHTLAGAYWRGSEKNPMLTRIYGLTFSDQTNLEEYLVKLEEAKKRDHRKLGKELDLFHIDELVGLGLPLWHPRGALLWRVIEDFWYQEHLKNDYELVRSPHIGNRSLWETSGHWGFYNNSMFPPLEAGQNLEERQQNQIATVSEEYLLKPMNCPFHVQIFNNDLRSYRDLPKRWAECGTVYRFEKKGELSGLTRVRGFTQDDAHIICQKSQVEEELKKVIDFILFIYKSFGFDQNQVHVFLSLRDPHDKTSFAGNDDGWEFTENILRKVAKEKNLNFTEELGEAAFYGPKLDFKIKDCLGRLWQCSTLQFDFNLPDRFCMNFTNDHGQKETPYMLHRALFGSFERFIGLLIEHFGGNFPLWLCPEQIRILSVGESHADYCQKLATEFLAQGLKVKVDLSNESVGKKIKSALNFKIPYLLVIGDKEMNSDKLQVKVRGQESLLEISQAEFIKTCLDKISSKALEL